MYRYTILCVAILAFTIGCVNGDSENQGLVVESSEEVELDMEEIKNECNETFPIKMEYLISLNETGSFPEETDKTPKCFIRCVFQKIMLMDKIGDIDEDLGAQYIVDTISISAEESKTLSSKCASERDEKCHCEKAYEYLKCVSTSIIAMK